MPMRSFLDHLEQFLHNQVDATRRSADADWPHIDLNDPDIAARVQWEALHHALSGRKYKKPPPLNDSNKVQRRMRRHSEELAEAAAIRIDGLLRNCRANALSGFESTIEWFNRKLNDLPEYCSALYFIDYAQMPAPDRLGQTLTALDKHIRRVESDAQHALTQEVERRIATLRREIEVADLTLSEIDEELAKANRYLVPPVEIDRASLLSRFQTGIADISAELAQSVTPWSERVATQTRRFHEQLQRALHELDADPAMDEGDAPSAPETGRITLPRPLPFKTLAQDYVEEALALYRAPPEQSSLRSRLGGQPNLPRHCEWPRSASGARLHFVAQIDLAEMAWRPPTMDNSGTLLFFLLLDDELAFGDGAVAVLYDESSTDHVAAVPADLEPVASVRLRRHAVHPGHDERLLAGYTLSSAKIASVPAPEALNENAHRKARLADYCRNYRPFREKQLFDASGCAFISHLGHHQMFGFVPSMQTPLAANSDMLTLLQIVSDDEFGLSIGDGGSIDFQISPEALAHQQWQYVRAVYAGG